MATRDGRTAFALTSLLNFRDVGLSINYYSKTQLLRPHLFYRSARPDEVTPSDRGRLLNDYQIKTIIDLRTPTEHIEQARNYAAATARQPAVVPAEPLAPVRIPEIRYEDVNLNGSSYANALIWQLSYHHAAKLIFYYAIGWRKDAIAILALNVMASRGLSGLAIDSLLYSRSEVRAVFSILSNAESYPLLVHCTQGKDRTGLTVLLVLMLCGVAMEAIERDYRLSESELQPERHEKLEEIRSIGLPDDFADCPAEWTGTVCAYINEELGGVETYLESCGIMMEQQERLKNLLMVRTEDVQI